MSYIIGVVILNLVWDSWCARTLVGLSFHHSDHCIIHACTCNRLRGNEWKSYLLHTVKCTCPGYQSCNIIILTYTMYVYVAWASRHVYKYWIGSSWLEVLSCSLRNHCQLTPLSWGSWWRTPPVPWRCHHPRQLETRRAAGTVPGGCELDHPPHRG